MSTCDIINFRTGQRRQAQTGSRLWQRTALVAMGAVAICAPSHAACWETAARRHGIDPVLLMAIGWQESRGWSHAVGPRLKDGNQAVGLMQINTVHLPRLRQVGISRQDLFDPCLSQQLGAWVLADCMQRFGQVWRAVGCYATGPGSKAHRAQAQYAAEVRHHYERYQRSLGRSEARVGSQPANVSSRAGGGAP